jgi:hypothetical protein
VQSGNGLWAGSQARPKGFPRPAFPLFLFLSFSFFVFSFLLKLLQNSFKSTQTTSKNSLEIHTTFLTQNNQVFKMKTRFLNKTF